MFSFWIKEEQIIWAALIASLLFHGLLLIFSFSTGTFIHAARFSVRPSSPMVEVSIERIQDTGDISRNKAQPMKIIKSPFKPLPILLKPYQVKTTGNVDFHNPAPEYPELSRQMRQEGLVILSVDVDRVGKPVKIEITRSSGFYLLDQAALKAVEHWRFQPGNMGGFPVDSIVTVPIRFRLEK